MKLFAFRYIWQVWGCQNLFPVTEPDTLVDTLHVGTAPTAAGVPRGTVASGAAGCGYPVVGINNGRWGQGMVTAKNTPKHDQYFTQNVFDWMSASFN